MPTPMIDPKNLPATAMHPGEQPLSYASPEQKQHLMTMIESIRGKLRDFHAVSFAGENKVERARREQLRAAFEELQQAGVNLNDRTSVAKFFQKLRNTNPSLGKQVESALDSLLGDASGSGFTPPKNMNIENNGTQS